jgi:Cu2+-exporting ATPase
MSIYTLGEYLSGHGGVAMHHATHPPATGREGTVTLRFQAALACPCCARDVEQTLRAHPHVLAVHVDPARQEVHVTAHAGAVTPAEIQSLIVRAGHGCRCTPLPGGTPAGGDLPALAHQADMAAVTMNTAADRMQYEFPATGAAHRHHAAPPEHAGMAHDLSDPRMARAMEQDIRNRFVVALALTVPTVLLSPLAVNTLGAELAPAGWRNWLMLALSTPVVWWSGWPFIGGAAASLRHRTLNMSVLIATGVLAAWGFSLLITLTTRGETFYEAAAMLVTFVLFGHWLEMKSRRGTTDALRALFDLVPPTATVIRDGIEQQVPTAQIQVGDRIRLRPGDKVPVDGVVVEGTTSVDESLVTGESIPVEKRPGDPVIGGSINRTGSVVIEALKVGSDTVLAQIVSLVQEAQRSKAPGQRLADRAAAWLVIAAVGSGVVTFLAWVVVGNASFHTALTFAISAVVIACPDALGLATPTAIAVATGLGARHQILVKDAATLEGLARVQMVVLDKTGTLTEGRPRLTDIVAAPANGGPALAEDDLLRLAAAAEQGSEHPLADAVVQAARERGLTLPTPEEFTAFSGRGIAARVDGHAVLVGTAAFLQERGIDPGPLAAVAERLAEAGKTPVFVAVDGRAAGVLAAADAIKPGARALIPLLKQAGIEVVMITGDNRRTAVAVARELGIERVFAEVLPDQKAEYVRRLQAEGKRVAMVGDGINDAPALAQADIGIAIGAGTDVAIETARVVLMKSDPLDVARAIRLSRATVRKMKQNLFWASIYNVLAIPVAAGALYPRFGVMLRPEWSALLMSLSSIIVATNAVLLRRVERELDGASGPRPAPSGTGPLSPGTVPGR